MNDPNHSTCQQTDTFTLAEHALTAQVLAERVQFLVGNAVEQLREASLGLYLSNPEQSLQNTQIVERAMSLVSNHGNVETGEQDKPKRGWHDDVPHHKDLPREGSGQGQVTKKMELVEEEMKAKADKGKSGDDGKQQQGQGGEDYSKYIPKIVPEKKGEDGHGHPLDKGKHDDFHGKYFHTEPESKGKKKDDDGHQPHKGDGSDFDYSQYYKGPEEKGKHNGKGSKEGSSSQSGSSGAGGYDYSKYIPQSKNRQRADNDDEDFLRKAAMELLQADLQMRAAIGSARRDVLERIKAVLGQLTEMVDRELADMDADQSSAGEPGTVDDSGLAPELVPASTNVTDAVTPAPSTGRGRRSEDDFWKRYIPRMPNDEAQAGDRRPGSQGGPCGRTDYKDFGACIDKSQTCQGLGRNKPGICRLDHESAVKVSRRSAIESLQIAEEAVQALRAASVELLVATAPGPLTDNRAAAVTGKDEKGRAAPLPVDPSQYSPTLIFVIALAFSVIGYLCCVKSASKRGSYNSIDGWGSNERNLA